MNCRLRRPEWEQEDCHTCDTCRVADGGDAVVPIITPTPAQIIRCAELCAASYDPDDTRFIDVGEHRFGWIIEDGVGYLVFRGTDNPLELLEDIEAVPVRTRTGYLAHAGFVGVADTFADYIISHPLYGNPPIIITGHSLGAAVALLMAESLSPCPVVHFGCPRTYSRLDETYPPTNQTRIVNSGDPIPDVPGPIAWRHLCDARILGDEIPLLKYHSIDLYVSRLKEAQDAVVQ